MFSQINVFFASAKEVMFSLAYVNLSVCLFFCFLARLCHGYSTNFHRIQWKGGMWAVEETLDFCGNLDHVTLGLGLGRVVVTVRWRPSDTHHTGFVDWG